MAINKDLKLEISRNVFQALAKEDNTILFWLLRRLNLITAYSFRVTLASIQPPTLLKK